MSDMGTKIGYGYSWRCQDCGEHINILFCDSISPSRCDKCGGDNIIDTPEDEAKIITEELCEKFGRRVKE